MIRDFILEHLVLSDGDVVIRSAHATDEPVLTKWFNDPDVFKYWEGRSPSEEYIRARCTVEVTDDACWPFIIVYGGEPAGFLQAWLRPDMTGGLDLFIAPEHRRKGVALRAVPLLAKYLRDERGWKRTTVDPRADNAAAIALFERAGFVDTGERLHDDDHIYTIMELR